MEWATRRLGSSFLRSVLRRTIVDDLPAEQLGGIEQGSVDLESIEIQPDWLNGIFSLGKFHARVSYCSIDSLSLRLPWHKQSDGNSGRADVGGINLEIRIGESSNVSGEGLMDALLGDLGSVAEAVRAWSPQSLVERLFPSLTATISNLTGIIRVAGTEACLQFQAAHAQGDIPCAALMEATLHIEGAAVLAASSAAKGWGNIVLPCSISGKAFADGSASIQVPSPLLRLSWPGVAAFVSLAAGIRTLSDAVSAGMNAMEPEFGQETGSPNSKAQKAGWSLAVEVGAATVDVEEGLPGLSPAFPLAAEGLSVSGTLCPGQSWSLMGALRSASSPLLLITKVACSASGCGLRIAGARVSTDDGQMSFNLPSPEFVVNAASDFEPLPIERLFEGALSNPFHFDYFELGPVPSLSLTIGEEVTARAEEAWVNLADSGTVLRAGAKEVTCAGTGDCSFRAEGILHAGVLSQPGPCEAESLNGIWEACYEAASSREPFPPKDARGATLGSEEMAHRARITLRDSARNVSLKGTQSELARLLEVAKSLHRSCLLGRDKLLSPSFSAFDASTAILLSGRAEQIRLHLLEERETSADSGRDVQSADAIVTGGSALAFAIPDRSTIVSASFSEASACERGAWLADGELWAVASSCAGRADTLAMELPLSDVYPPFAKNAVVRLARDAGLVSTSEDDTPFTASLVANRSALHHGGAALLCSPARIVREAVQETGNVRVNLDLECSEAAFVICNSAEGVLRDAHEGGSLAAKEKLFSVSCSWIGPSLRRLFVAGKSMAIEGHLDDVAKVIAAIETLSSDRSGQQPKCGQNAVRDGNEVDEGCGDDEKEGMLKQQLPSWSYVSRPDDVGEMGSFIQSHCSDGPAANNHGERGDNNNRIGKRTRVWEQRELVIFVRGNEALGSDDTAKQALLRLQLHGLIVRQVGAAKKKRIAIGAGGVRIDDIGGQAPSGFETLLSAPQVDAADLLQIAIGAEIKADAMRVWARSPFPWTIALDERFVQLLVESSRRVVGQLNGQGAGEGESVASVSFDAGPLQGHLAWLPRNRWSWLPSPSMVAIWPPMEVCVPRIRAAGSSVGEAIGEWAQGAANFVAWQQSASLIRAFRNTVAENWAHGSIKRCLDYLSRAFFS